jgi:hypothetical protein
LKPPVDKKYFGSQYHVALKKIKRGGKLAEG